MEFLDLTSLGELENTDNSWEKLSIVVTNQSASKRKEAETEREDYDGIKCRQNI